MHQDLVHHADEGPGVLAVLEVLVRHGHADQCRRKGRDYHKLAHVLSANRREKPSPGDFGQDGTGDGTQGKGAAP